MSERAVRIDGALLRFLVVGSTTVALDAAFYALLVAFSVPHDIAKAVSFVLGAVFAYFANWRFTFGQRRSRFSELAFVGVYAAALVINVALNALVRGVLPPAILTDVFAFLVATGCSAAWNYVGMSLWVFQRRTPKEDVS